MKREILVFALILLSLNAAFSFSVSCASTSLNDTSYNMSFDAVGSYTNTSLDIIIPYSLNNISSATMQIKGNGTTLPSDITIDTGNDGFTDYTVSGELSDPVVIDLNSTAMTRYLRNSCSSGNCLVPIKITSATAGNVIASDFRITFNATEYACVEGINRTCGTSDNYCPENYNSTCITYDSDCGSMVGYIVVNEASLTNYSADVSNAYIYSDFEPEIQMLSTGTMNANITSVALVNATDYAASLDNPSYVKPGYIGTFKFLMTGGSWSTPASGSTEGYSCSDYGKTGSVIFNITYKSTSNNTNSFQSSSYNYTVGNPLDITSQSISNGEDATVIQGGKKYFYFVLTNHGSKAINYYFDVSLPNNWYMTVNTKKQTYTKTELDRETFTINSKSTSVMGITLIPTIMAPESQSFTLNVKDRDGCANLNDTVYFNLRSVSVKGRTEYFTPDIGFFNILFIILVAFIAIARFK